MATCVALLLLLIAAQIGVNLSQRAAQAANAAQQAVRAAPVNSAVTTYRNDNGRTGQYPNETILNTSNVNVSQFGKRVSYPVDGQMYAQPLYVPNLTIGGTVHNVVFAATENDTVYAFDADATSAGTPLWKTSLLPSGATAVPNSAVNCGDLTPVIGITSTPVIDPTTSTMYVVAYDDEGGTLVYRLHALNILTGQDISPPIVIQGSTPGTGAGSSGGAVTFNAGLERQRTALVLANGHIYIAFASFCDNGNYHGFIFSYNYNGSAFSQVNVYNDTPNGIQGGIWGGDAGLDADSNGSMYYMSGNGTFDASSGGSDYGDSFVRLNAALQVQDYFTPFNQSCISAGDQDLGSSGPLLLTGSNVLIGAGKEGRPYVVSTTNMGKFTNDPNLTCNGSAEENRTNVDNIQQELPPGTVGPDFSTPTFWNGSAGQFVYFTSVNGTTQAFSLSSGKLSTTPTSTSASGNGGTAVVSGNGTTAGTGIVWKIDTGSVLHAYNAGNLATELYNSNQNASRDGLNGYVKFSAPVVTNGEVFVGLSSSLAIFGLLSTTPPPPPPPGGFQVNAGGPAVAPFAADENFTGGSTASVTHAIDTSGVTSPAPAAVYQSNRYGNFTYVFPRPDRRRELYGSAAFCRGVLDDGWLAHLQRRHQRKPGADQLRHPGHRRGRIQGGDRTVHRRGRQRRKDHHPVRHRQGQRPGQWHRDPVGRQPAASADGHADQLRRAGRLAVRSRCRLHRRLDRERHPRDRHQRRHQSRACRRSTRATGTATSATSSPASRRAIPTRCGCISPRSSGRRLARASSTSSSTETRC